MLTTDDLTPVLCAACMRDVLHAGYPVEIRADWWREQIGEPDGERAAELLADVTGWRFPGEQPVYSLRGVNAVRFLALAARRGWRVYSPAVGYWCPRGITAAADELRCEGAPAAGAGVAHRTAPPPLAVLSR